jgi:PIN domain nuclease of toxin-antitoxin system
MLLDTNVFLRYFLEPKRLKRQALADIESFEGDVYVSAVSIWEIAIKSALGRLRIPGDLSAFVRHRMDEARFTELPVAIDHAVAMRSLPLHHADPFDRMLIAQAQVEGLPIVSSDRQFDKYKVRVISA